MKKNFVIKAKIWRWPTSVNTSTGKPGDGGWHFVTLDKKLSEKIRSVYTKGFVKIEAKVGKTLWNTSLFPHKQAGYILCINKKIRKIEELFEGDEIKVSVVIK